MIPSGGRPVDTFLHQNLGKVSVLESSPGPSPPVPRVSRHHIPRDNDQIRLFLIYNVPDQPLIVEIVLMTLPKVYICQLDHLELPILIESQLFSRVGMLALHESKGE